MWWKLRDDAVGQKQCKHPFHRMTSSLCLTTGMASPQVVARASDLRQGRVVLLAHGSCGSLRRSTALLRHQNCLGHPIDGAVLLSD
jgi:hypothetical protein